MSKRSDTARGRERTGATQADRRAGSGQYKVTDRRRAIREASPELRQVTPRTSRHADLHAGQRSTRSRRDTVRRAAKIVVRLHRDALKELEKY
jgi:hypothetical protein